MSALEKVLLIANPTAANGAAAQAAQRATEALRARLGQEAVQLVLTAGPQHATELAAGADGVSTVVVLGGDGVIHEAAAGLMRRPADARPALGIIPVGSGNDYARALGVPAKLDEAVELLFACGSRPTDVGCVNGQFFVETLSFGVDAAIALDTVERRVRTGRTGTVLYFEAGLDQLTHHLDKRHNRTSFDGAPAVDGTSITYAVQVGPYYGGGFKICPQAALDDGRLDVCISHPPAGPVRAVCIFALALGGHHTGLSQVEMRQCRSLHVDFDEQPPAQIDGERIEACTFDVSVQPAALQVLRP